MPVGMAADYGKMAFAGTEMCYNLEHEIKFA